MHPVKPETGGTEIVIAENQDEFLTLRISLALHPGFEPAQSGVCYVSRWRLSEEDKQAILRDDADIYLCMITGGGPMQPVIITTTPEDLPPPLVLVQQ